MLARDLWAKEYNQSKMMVWAFLGVVLGTWPLAVLLNIVNLTPQLPFIPEGDLTIWGGMFRPFGLNGFSHIVALLTIVLGCTLIGSERVRNIDEFTMMLPHPRGRIYLVKWTLGAVTIAATLTIAAILTALVINFSGIKPYLYEQPPILAFWWRTLWGTLALHTLVMFLGTLSGATGFQAALSIIYSVFPLGFGALVLFFLEMHGLTSVIMDRVPNFPLASSIEEILLKTSLVPNIVMVGTPTHINSDTWLYAIPYLLIFLPWGVGLYKHNKLEHNGRFLIFPGMHWFMLTGIVFCFGLLGGMVFSGFSYDSLPTYYTGFIVFAAASYWAASKLVRGVWRAA